MNWSSTGFVFWECKERPSLVFLSFVGMMSSSLSGFRHLRGDLVRFVDMFQLSNGGHFYLTQDQTWCSGDCFGSLIDTRI